MSLPLADLWPSSDWVRERWETSLENVVRVFATVRSTPLRNLSQHPRQLAAWLRQHDDVAEFIMTAGLLWLSYKAARFVLFQFLALLGFTSGGVRKDSAAARYQSEVYGGYTPKGSRFSGMQARGATESGFFGTKTIFVLCLAVVSYWVSTQDK